MFLGPSASPSTTIWSHFGRQTTVKAPRAAGFFGIGAGAGAGAAATAGRCVAVGVDCAVVGAGGIVEEGTVRAPVVPDVPAGGGGVIVDGGATTVVGVGGEGAAETAVLNAVRAAVNGPGPATVGLGPFACGRGCGLVAEMMAITTPAMKSANEHESAATTHMGGRRLNRWAIIVRLSRPACGPRPGCPPRGMYALPGVVGYAPGAANASCCICPG